MENYSQLRKYIREKLEESYQKSRKQTLSEEIALITNEVTAITLLDDSMEGIDIDRVIKSISQKVKDRAIIKGKENDRISSSESDLNN